MNKREISAIDVMEAGHKVIGDLFDGEHFDPQVMSMMIMFTMAIAKVLFPKEEENNG